MQNGRRFGTATRKLAFEPLLGRLMLAGHAGGGHGVPDEDPVTDVEVGHANPKHEQKIDQLKSYFDDVIQNEHGRFLRMSIQSARDGLQLYNLQFALDGMLSMYEATQDRSVLDKVMTYSDEVMRAAHIIEGGRYENDGFLDWEVTSAGLPRSQRQGFLLYDFQIGSALSRLARILHESAHLEEAFAEYGRALADFVDRQIVYKWLDARNQRAVLLDFYDNHGYWTDKATHLVSTCHNLRHVLGDDFSCRGLGKELAQHFKKLLVTQDDDAYLWGIWRTLPVTRHLAPDTAHENRVATMVAQLGADGFVYDHADIEHLARTFTERIWNGRTDWEDSPGVQDSPWFHNYIDGSDESYRDTVFARHGPEGVNGFVYDGWVRLGQFVPEVQQAGEALLGFIQDFRGSVNAIHRRNGSVFGRVALSGHLARNLRFAQPLGERVSAAQGTATTTNDDDLRSSADLNLDGVVSFADFLILSHNFGKTSSRFEDGDLTGDGTVSIADFLQLSRQFT